MNANLVTQDMIDRAKDACCIGNAYFSPESDDEWREAIAAAIQGSAVAVAADRYSHMCLMAWQSESINQGDMDDEVDASIARHNAKATQP